LEYASPYEKPALFGVPVIDFMILAAAFGVFLLMAATYEE